MIAAVDEKKKSSAITERDKNFSMSANMAMITGKWFPYDCYDHCIFWTFFLSDYSNRSDHNDHMETRL